ncbi:MAG: helix-turn-helix transcriptional regulator [Ilumatobacteraceae bacterium]
MTDVVLDRHEGEDVMAMWLCRFDADDPGGWGTHAHRQHQLAWVSCGLSTAVVDGVRWTVSPTRAVWIPSGWPHDITNHPGARLHCLYMWPEHSPVGWPEPCELAVTPIARELLAGLGDSWQETTIGAASATVLLAELGRERRGAPTLPMPADERAVELAEALIVDPANQDSLEQWSRRLATSASTLRRAFLAETGLTFSEWRTRVRLDAALPLLNERVSVDRVARRVGYASRSGFIDAFHRHFGHPPGQHRASAGRQVRQAG